MGRTTESDVDFGLGFTSQATRVVISCLSLARANLADSRENPEGLSQKVVSLFRFQSSLATVQT